ncbi:MAG: hypothetical protein V1815_02080 [Candidatus Woesearchaeota archaeon]
MKEEVKKDILDILHNSFIAIKERNILQLQELSNHTLHDASIFQDEDSISIAVVIYSLSKILERTRYQEYRNWNIFYKIVMENLEKAQESLKNNSFDKYQEHIKDILNVIDKLDEKFKRYISEVIEKARISKASRIYEHGISISRTSQLLGINEWELMDYIGKTGIADVEFSITKNVKERIKFARSLFK